METSHDKLSGRSGTHGVLWELDLMPLSTKNPPVVSVGFEPTTPC